MRRSRTDELGRWALTALAAYRLWRLVGRDEIAEPLRQRLTERLRAPLECPWCAGSWVAFACYAVAARFTHVPAPVLQGLAGAAAVGLIGQRLDRDPDVLVELDETVTVNVDDSQLRDVSAEVGQVT